MGARVTPYVVAFVELAEQDGLRLLTNLVGCPDADLRCDLEVEVLFASTPLCIRVPAGHRPMTRGFEQDCAISGIGISEVGRRLGRDPWALTADAAMAAIGDAGLTPDDIDGVSTYPGGNWPTPGMTGAGVYEVVRLLGLVPTWHTGAGEVAGQLGAVVNAAMAVATGLNRPCFGRCGVTRRWTSGAPPRWEITAPARSPVAGWRATRRSRFRTAWGTRVKARCSRSGTSTTPEPHANSSPRSRWWHAPMRRGIRARCTASRSPWPTTSRPG